MNAELIRLAHHPDWTQREADIDTQHRFKGFGIHDSQVRVRIWFSSGDSISFDKPVKGISSATITELKAALVVITDGEGTSVTNAAEQLVEECFRDYLGGLSTSQVLFFEHYEDYGTFDRILPEYESLYPVKVRDVEWQYFGTLEPRKKERSRE